jgi:hypothetical protein
MKCVWEEIKDKPGYQWCPVCKKARGWPKGQSRPADLPPMLLRACTGPPENPEDRDRDTPLPPPENYKIPAVSTGFGDTVAKGISVMTGGLVQPCGGCIDRKDFLNYVIPYNQDQS